VAGAALAIWWPRAEAPAPPPIAQKTPEPEEPVVVRPAPAPLVDPPEPTRRPRRAIGQRAAPQPVEPKFVSAMSPSVVIRIETPDPEVVILLVN
jgi:hypothetical protein